MGASSREPPLAGLRVLDASRVLAGPFCGQLLADLGADVVKIERPGSGDETRSWGPPFAGDLSAYFLSCNRNKKSLTLDLAQPEGRALFCELVRASDIVIENFRAASADRLGLEPASLLEINPRIIVCSISGYGRTGSWSERPGYDFAIQGLSGLMSITGPVDGPPTKVGVALTDVVTGLYAATAILACVHARQTSGHGYAIDLALLDCAVAAQVNVAQAFLTSGQVPPRQGNAHLQIVPYQAFAARDGWIILAVGNDGQWQRFCAAVERRDWAEDARFATNVGRVENRVELVAEIAKLIATRTVADWEMIFTQAEVSHAPVLDYNQLFDLPPARERGLRVTVRDAQGRPLELLSSPVHIDGATQRPPTAPPELGQDTDDVLRGVLGLDAERIAELRGKKVI